MFFRKMLFAAFVLLFLSSEAVASGAVWYVDGSVAESGDGRTWGRAFKTIQEGIKAASDGDIVMVAEGTYFENIELNGKNIILQSKPPLSPSVVANTAIDGKQRGPVVRFQGTEDESCVLRGFTIQNGTADFGGGIQGGLGPDRTRATIENNVITGNWAEYGSGGIDDCEGTIRSNIIAFNEVADPDGRGGGLDGCPGTIENNTITGNRAAFGGGLSGCAGKIQNNAVIGNEAGLAGGGLYACDGVIRNNTVAGNSAQVGGGLCECWGIIESNTVAMNAATLGGGLQYCLRTIANNIITGNRAGSGGGLHDCYGTIQNNTICENVAQAEGGGLLFCRAAISNCVISGNRASVGAQLHLSRQPAYSCIQDWAGGGEGNIAEDPQFMDVPKDDFRLSASSPCIDTGFNDPDLPETDAMGMRRTMYGGKSLTVDMGAYEYYIHHLKLGPGAGQTTLTWSSVGDMSYSIFYSHRLLTWHIAIDNFPSAGNQTTSWIDDGSITGVPPSLAPRRFYRVLENP